MAEKRKKSGCFPCTAGGMSDSVSCYRAMIYRRRLY